MGPNDKHQHYVSFVFAGADGLIEVRIDNPRMVNLSGDGDYGLALVTDSEGVEHHINSGWLVMKRVVL